ncbi:MbcA/ParS/Xre antitoxin family protein [Salinarimonas ramus]|uniref:Antitoxin Xre/MbcA/ParS-like toxin-binding domain-containing protein n=1 Tax=Salinarimonas ramus TaxID=690164 RepID=A0A917Q7G3_9HYPH|nr:MbcA/ParS/Xre antitoxin family protein [Salinarimonas ramus]GGK34235.1 hypothetical protein GCM10011322_21180 [Salinarimonas ramus]
MRLEAIVEHGLLTPDRIAQQLRTTRDEVAHAVGVGRDAMLRPERIASAETQKRLRELVDILDRAEACFGSTLIAYAWYRSEPLAGFGGETAMQLVREGRASEVMEYIDAVDAGVYA